MKIHELITETAPLAELSEECGYLAQGSAATWYDLGRLASGITAYAGETRLPNLRGEGAGVVARGVAARQRGTVAARAPRPRAVAAALKSAGPRAARARDGIRLL